MNLLKPQLLTGEQSSSYEQMKQAPITVLQIGEGNFLRGFVDWMLQQCRKQGLYEGSVAVTQPRPGGKPKIEALAQQDGLYTLVIRGLENGQRVERTEIVSVFGQVFDPYSEWDSYLALAENPHLQVVVSNTTEAGLVYRPEKRVDGQPIQSFPGKLTELLYRRFTAFAGDPVCLASYWSATAMSCAPVSCAIARTGVIRSNSGLG
jgi:tagaturonate reductase